MTHKEAVAKFKRCRNKERGYKLANNTLLQKRGHAFAVRLHQTDVVMIRPDGTYRLNSGGYRTATTKNRMDMVIPCCVSQTNGIWYIGDTHYEDGILIGPDGKVINAKPANDIQKIKRGVDRQVSKFIKLLTQSCSGLDIGTWESYRRHTLPRLAKNTSLKKLWDTILLANLTLPLGMWADESSHLFIIIYLATLSRGYDNPHFIWDLMRASCRPSPSTSTTFYYWCDTSPFIPENLRAFMRPRKTLIAEMIASKELADGTV